MAARAEYEDCGVLFFTKKGGRLQIVQVVDCGLWRRLFYKERSCRPWRCLFYKKEAADCGSVCFTKKEVAGCGSAHLCLDLG
eukprot:1134761-Pelagomonas_calceolata.AAC.4